MLPCNAGSASSNAGQNYRGLVLALAKIIGDWCWRSRAAASAPRTCLEKDSSTAPRYARKPSMRQRFCCGHVYARTPGERHKALKFPSLITAFVMQVTSA